MPIETRSNSALFKRAEQLKRWEDSDTNKVSSHVPADKTSRIQFSEGCVFLAACAANDTEEVERLLEQGADINTANVDGLTALHQACIDDNLDMVQFLVEHGCDVNRGDNEGWTPLHATASCGFISIAKYLIEHGANVAAVNNDGDLPIDIAELPEMEDLLSDVLDEQGIDCDEARSEEERVMLEDAKQWLNSKKFQDKVHPRTGATALHVAAAKGYISVMKILIQAGADLNAQDNDGWTALHAAAHWGQKEACAILADNLANMDIQNLAGQTCFDVAEHDLVKLLEELKKKQASMQKERPEIQAILQRTSSNRPPLKRRTSVTRMSGQEKSKSVMKDTKSERVQIEQMCLPEEDTEEEKERKASDSLQRLGVVKPELSASEERELAMQRKDALLESAVQEKPPPPKDVGPEKVPSWKKFLRRHSGDSEADVEKIFEDIIVKKPKTSDETEMETSNGPVEEENKERATSIEATHPPNPPTDAGSECSSSTPSSPSDTSSESQSQTKRPFIPPIRDEESELQRKAHAKRVRETRRSTQGVLLEDIKTAEMQYLMKAQQEAANRQDTEKKGIENDDAEDDDDKEKSPTPPPVMQTRWSQKSEENQKKDKEITETSGDKSAEQHTVAKESTGKAAQEVPSSPDTSTVTIPLRTKTSNSNNNTSEEQSQQDNRSSLGTQAAIQRRRRPKRRSTGVVYLDSDDAQDEKLSDSKENIQCPTPEKSQKEQTLSISERAKQKYGSSTSLPDTSSEVSSRGETPSRYSSVSSSRSSLIEDSNKDYKKLYEETKKDNERLKEKLKKTEDELERVKQQLQKSTQNNNTRNSVSETEKKERRALERRISEMEEEVKLVEKLRADNERLRDENGALIRVISKLSK